MARLVTLLLVFAAAVRADIEVPEPPKHPYVEIVTTEGRILLELDGVAAPFTVDNFLNLVDEEFYDGTIFHRVIQEFMIQGGGYTPGLKLIEDEGGIPNESGNGLSNLRGTIAMARSTEPHTANSQFYINVVDNTRLDPGKNKWGYTVFGYVIEGLEVADAISQVPTGPQGDLASDVPQVPVIIETIRRYEFK